MALLADRYRAHELLGRGGMACVYRVEDLATGAHMALKQLVLQPGASNNAVLSALFEREFHTLAQLRHPHVIAVHDYGLLADSCPYYTMELLDGGDLRDRAPLPWREVCRLFFDVCSSLALLHSRRLLHRDISPRNVRCTRDGHARLIDFGAMAPMTSGGATLVGTPAFVAPETLHRSALDARTDLFSLGATLYHALTGQVPYPARTFADSLAAWQSKVPAPSVRVPDVPSGLDDLVLALINPEPTLRPHSAYEVMQRLAALADLPEREAAAVSAAYLTTPTLVGREAMLRDFRERLVASRVSRAGALLFEGPAGVGRSRLLDACALEAKTLGFTVLRARARNTRARYAAAHELTEHLVQALPGLEFQALAPELFAAGAENDNQPRLQLRAFSDTALDAEQLQRAICALWIGVSRSHPLLIAVDDVHRIDPQSAAVLVALLDSPRRSGTFLALSADSDEASTEALHALSRRAASSSVAALTREQTHALLGSLFGDVVNLELLARDVHDLARGNPRQTIDVAQHLVDRGKVRYSGGGWSLPNQLSAEDLPYSASDALRARARELSPHARFLAEAQALAFYESLSDLQYRALLPQASPAEVERALHELLALGALAGDGSNYTLANKLWIAAMSGEIDRSELESRHRALAAMYQPSSKVAFIYHAIAGGMDAAGIEALQRMNAQLATSEVDHDLILQQNIGKLVACFPRVLQSAQRLRLSPRALNDLRRWNVAGMTTTHFGAYPESAPAWLAQLEHDSGLDLYRADPLTDDPQQRLTRALSGAYQRYLATPEAERVYPVDEAIRLLAEYVVFAIVIASRTQDAVLMRSLPQLLEPFAPLSPVLDAIWNNALATCTMQTTGAFESARSRWITVLATLDTKTDSEVKYAKEIAHAVAFAIGMLEAHLGLQSALRWTERLEQSPYHRVAALQLRRILRLEQGDWQSAERFRRQAELMSLRMPGPQMFSSMLVLELAACAKGCDLTGVRDVIERMQPLAASFPGWRPPLLQAQASFDLVRGDYEAARLKCEEAIALSEFRDDGWSPSASVWFNAHAALAEALLGLGRAQHAKAVAARALHTRGVHADAVSTIDLVRALALAEAKLGDPCAAQRIEAAISEQLRVGATGLRLGLSYETRALIAVLQGDRASFERYAELTAREYRYGAGSGLGARYDRLINEARRHGLVEAGGLTDFATWTATEGVALTRHDVMSEVLESMARTRHASDRAQAALQLLCASRHATSGHLYLTSSAGLVRCASLGTAAPLGDLTLLKDFVAREQLRTELETDGVSYELVLLSCVISDRTQAVGVAAIAGAEPPSDASRELELVQALARHFIDSGDSTGFAVA
ncbi:MAG TPA: serine/threonine-protein kinase [Polyangiales bacterium]|nr:serine/threonine-protein kinase [Polyangiales bacterium]